MLGNPFGERHLMRSGRTKIKHPRFPIERFCRRAKIDASKQIRKNFMCKRKYLGRLYIPESMQIYRKDEGGQASSLAVSTRQGLRRCTSLGRGEQEVATKRTLSL
ncbi:unnamed protein product [Musa textilis]